MLQLKALEYMEAIYKYKNFTKAASALFVSQPAISASIRKLEEELGLKLVIRTPKKVIFTEDGEQFMLRTQPLLQELRAIEADMINKHKYKKTVLHLGLSPTTPPNIIHHIYKDFLPSLTNNEEVLFDEGGTYYHIEKIISGELDLAINAIPEDLANYNIHSIPVHRQEICLLIRSDSDLASYDKIPIQLLESTRLTSLGESSYLPKRLEVEASKRNIYLNIASKHLHQTSYIEEILLGHVAGIINVDNSNTFRALYNHKELVSRPFLEPMYLNMGIMYHNDVAISPLSHRIIQFVREISRWKNASKQ